MPGSSKGQMVIVTIVFLVGLIFIVQQILLQYTFIDMPASFRGDDYNIVRGVEDALALAVSSASSCQQAKDNLDETILFIRQQSMQGYSISISYNSQHCPDAVASMGPDDHFDATARITGESFDTTEKLALYSNEKTRCICVGWADKGCSTPKCGDGYKLLERTCAPAGCDIESTCRFNNGCLT